MSLLTPLMMGVSLAATTGLRGGLPLLLTAVFARTGQVPWHPHFAFLTTDTAIGVLLLVTLIEIGGDFIPGLDHAFDALYTLTRPASATLILSGLLVGIHPVVGTLIGLLVGGSISGLVHLVKAGCRVVISTATFGIANVFLSLIENIVAGLMALFALVAPEVVFFMTLLFLMVLLFIARRLWKRLRQGTTGLKQRFTALISPAKPTIKPIVDEEDFPSFDEAEF